MPSVLAAVGFGDSAWCLVCLRQWGLRLGLRVTVVPSLLAAVGFGVVSYSTCGSGVWGCELPWCLVCCGSGVLYSGA